MKCREIIDKLEELSPKGFAADWDNPGLMVGSLNKEVSKVFIALDATDEVIDRAIAQKCDMIITHHPMIFKGIKSVTEDDFTGRRVIKLIKENISCYAMHTNFDVCVMGEAAANMLLLENTEVLDVTYEDGIEKQGYGRVGDLPRRMTLRDCANRVKDVFGLDTVKVFGNLDDKVLTLAVSPGGGGSILKAALASDADVFLTGDIDYNPGIDAVAQGMAIIDAGHFGTEKLFMNYIKEYLHNEFPTLMIATFEDSPCSYI